MQVEIHVGGELVESLTEAEPDTPEQEALSTSAEEDPGTGKQVDYDVRVDLTLLQGFAANDATVAMVTFSLFSESFPRISLES